MKYSKEKTILITGGNGYIGSCLAAQINKKYNTFIIDKGRKNIFLKNKNIKFFKFDINNLTKLDLAVKSSKPDVIIHLAAQSTIDFVNIKRSSYLLDNIKGTRNIIKVCKKNKIKNLIFSSTASVYKEKNVPLSESVALEPNNIYGKTKLINEEDIKKKLKNSRTKFCILRFFNVCSSLKDYKIGEFHSPETHLIPKVINSILNKKKIDVYGNKYETPDGTCIRDFIHIKDIINGILKSIKYLENHNSNTFNLGSARQFSVLDIIYKTSQILKTKPSIKVYKNRKGDLAKLNCKIKKANKKLNWYPINSNLNKIIKDEIWWFKYLKKRKLKRNFFISK